MRGLGRVIFVAILLLIAGTLNIIYGIEAVNNAHFFDGTQYAFSTLHTWGWVAIIVGIIQLTGGFSLFGAGAYGRFIGIFAATRNPHSWKFSTQRRISPLGTIISICPLTFRMCFSSRLLTVLIRYRDRSWIAWRSCDCPVTVKRKKMKSHGVT